MKTKLLQLSAIVTTTGTQIRARIDADTVEQYAEAMQDASNKFPPVVVFHDGSQFILADGFHRVMAATRNGFTDIEAEVNKGTRSDALRFALGANSTHGLKRTNLDKRRSVELALGEWPKLSDREIARICAVGADMVGSARQLSENDSSETRVGADGKERKLPTRAKVLIDAATNAAAEDRAMTAKDIREAASEIVVPNLPTGVVLSMTTDPAPKPNDEAWLKAIGTTDARNFYASQLEDIGSSCVESGSVEQINALKMECIVWERKLKAAVKNKQQSL